MQEHSKSENLVQQKNAMSVSNETSLRALRRTRLANEMRVTALNAKTEPAAELTAEFDRVFATEPAEGIEWAFRAWRERSGFFPALSDIRALVDEWKRLRRAEAEEQRQLAEKAEIEQARAEGKLASFPEIAQQLDQIVKRMPDAARSDQRTVTVAKRYVSPAVQMTREEIEKRRPAERAEIERVRREMEGS